MITRNRSFHTGPVFKTIPAPTGATRSRRAYTPSELATAKLMLDKLRRREDVAAAVLREPLPRPYDADRTLDAAIDRLLDRT